jgi:hypothetical protein
MGSLNTKDTKSTTDTKENQGLCAGFEPLCLGVLRVLCVSEPICGEAQIFAPEKEIER